MSDASVLQSHITDFIDIISEVNTRGASDACYMGPRPESSCGRAPRAMGTNIPISAVGTLLHGVAQSELDDHSRVGDNARQCRSVQRCVFGEAYGCH